MTIPIPRDSFGFPLDATPIGTPSGTNGKIVIPTGLRQHLDEQGIQVIAEQGIRIAGRLAQLLQDRHEARVREAESGSPAHLPELPGSDHADPAGAATDPDQ